MLVQDFVQYHCCHLSSVLNLALGKIYSWSLSCTLVVLFFTFRLLLLAFLYVLTLGSFRLKYSISIVADKGLKKSLYTSARLKKGEVIYLETHFNRYKLFPSSSFSSNDLVFAYLIAFQVVLPWNSLLF